MHEQFLVGIGGLISYQHMGSMKLNCKGGCSCLSLTYNMHHAQVSFETAQKYNDSMSLATGTEQANLRPLQFTCSSELKSVSPG